MTTEGISTAAAEGEAAVAELLSILDLERLDADLFRGQNANATWQRVFGGQVIGQALTAAYRTVEDRPCHSLHAYFIRPGDPKTPIIYEVDRARDGRSFTTRRVTAIQSGRQIFNLAASFQTAEDGLEHQAEMPGVPFPEDLKTERELREGIANKLPEEIRRMFARPRPIEIRPVAPRDFFKPEPMAPLQHVWFRAQAPLGPSDVTNQCALAYASDMTLLDTCQRPHGVHWMSRRLQVASLDHAMWFHGPVEMSQWHLYAQDSPGASGGRGLNRGLIFTRDGRLVASVAQEGLIRQRG